MNKLPLFKYGTIWVSAAAAGITYWRRQWQPTPVLLPGKSHGPGSLVGCSPWGRKESGTTERLHFHSSLSRLGEGSGSPLQGSCLENPRDGGTWWAAISGVAQCQTPLKRLSSSSSSSRDSVQFSRSVMSDSLRPHESQHVPGLPVHHQLLEFTQTHVHRVDDAIQPSHPLSSPSPPAFNFPSIRVFSSESALHMRWPKYWSFSFSISPLNTQDWSPLGWIGWISLQSKELSRVFSQHHDSKASILLRSAFFTVQLSCPYMTTGKTIVLTRWTFVGKVMALLFNMLSRLVITFLPRSKRLLISWLQSPSAVILEPKKMKSDTVSTVSPFICHEVMGPDAMILVFWMLSFKPTFSLSSFTFVKRLFSSSSLSAIRVVS